MIGSAVATAGKLAMVAKAELDRELGRTKAAQKHKGVVLIVGHQPDLGVFASWLAGSKKTQIDFAKAGVACIEFENAVDKGEGKLIWLVTTEWFQHDK